MFLICGLGNPGKEYVNSRHNIGFQLADKLANFYKIEKNKLFIIHDDLDLSLGKVKIKFGGGNGGHNGLSSVDEMIGVNYYRLRIGIDHPGLKYQVSNYVLNKFTDLEMDVIESRLNKITKNFDLLLDDSSLLLTKIAEEK